MSTPLATQHRETDTRPIVNNGTVLGDNNILMVHLVSDQEMVRKIEESSCSWTPPASLPEKTCFCMVKKAGEDQERFILCHTSKPDMSEYIDPETNCEEVLLRIPEKAIERYGNVSLRKLIEDHMRNQGIEGRLVGKKCHISGNITAFKIE